MALPTLAAFSRITVSVVTFFKADAMSDARNDVALRPTPSLVTRKALYISSTLLVCQGIVYLGVAWNGTGDIGGVMIIRVREQGEDTHQKY